MAMNRDDCPRLMSLAVHEFRTPVTVVAGYIRMLLKLHGNALGEQPRKMLEEAEKSCGRLSALIAELSELSNMEAGDVAVERREIEIFGLVEEAAASVHEGADRGVQLELPSVSGRAVLDGDRARLGDALTTLIMATLRERAEAGVVLAQRGVRDADSGPFAYLVIAPRDSRHVSPDFDASQWLPLEPWRGGLGFKLVTASEIIAAHGGALFSPVGADARAACALTLPVKEFSC